MGVTVQWEGRPVGAQPGQSLAAALWAAGVRDLGAAGEPARGLYCGVGHCFACRVCVDGVHGVRACLVRVRDGLRAEREPARGLAAGSPTGAGGAQDGGRVAEVHAGQAGPAPTAALPAGPALAGGRPVAADTGVAATSALAPSGPQVGLGRHLTGTSADAPEPASPARDTTAPHVAVLGAGPAGLAAAAVLGDLGARVTVVDEAAEPGGALRFVDAARAADLAARARAAGARILCGASAWGVHPAWRLALAAVDPGAGPAPVEVVADGLILATGATQLPLALPGWTLPGVVAPWAALHLLRAGALGPGTRVAVVGLDPVTLAAARALRAAAPAVELVALVAPRPSALVTVSPRASADRSPGLTGLPLLSGRAATALVGVRRVEAVRTCAADGAGAQDVAVDLAVAGAGLAPLTDAAQLAGVPARRIAALGGFVPLHGPSMETPLAGLFIAGGATGAEGVDVAVAEGRRAAFGCAGALGLLGDGVAAAARQAAATAELAEARARAGASDPDAAAGRAEVARLWAADGPTRP